MGKISTGSGRGGLIANTRGNVAMMFAVVLVPLCMLALGCIDIARAASAKDRLQTSLDAAALAAARSGGNQAATQRAGMRFLQSALGEMDGVTLDTSTTRFRLRDGSVSASARVMVRPIVSSFVFPRGIPLYAESQVRRGRLEVALVLDTTGSMADGGRIDDLRSAAADLVDIVVPAGDSPFDTRVAVVPYSMAVNVGDLADEVRGSVRGGSRILRITQTNPVTVTSPNHRLSPGDQVYLSGLDGMSELNGGTFTVASTSGNTFALAGVDGRAFEPYRSGGASFCAEEGCEYLAFTNARGEPRTHRVSTCVTERTGSAAYTDASPRSTPLGRNYPSAANPCALNEVVPLTDDRGQLHQRIAALQASGSTGGHIGVAWGWYMVSPNFGRLWPAANRPVDYDADDLLKVVVVMTDGEYNSSYCRGVISRDSTTGSGSPSDHIDCDAPNGHAFQQARRLCERMKGEGVIVYTVGFDVVDDQRARDLVAECATNARHVHFASDGPALREAFRAIGRDILNLRISR